MPPERRRLLPLLLLLALACKAPAPAAEEEASAPRPRVRVEQVKRGPVERTLRLPGALAPAPGRDVRLGALVAGRLARLDVAEGERVRAGQLLGVIEAGPSRDELQQAEAGLHEAGAAAEAAQAKRERTEALLARGIAARQDAEAARTDEATATAALRRARAEVDLARRKLARSELRAPFDGVVLSVSVAQGEAVEGNGSPVLEVAAVDPLELRALLPPEQAALLRVGMPATLRAGSPEAQAEAQAPLGAQVVAVSPAADAASGHVLVRVRAANPAGALRPGLLGEALVRVGSEPDALSVPSSALLPSEDGGAALALVQEGKAHRVPVAVRFEQGGRAVVQGDVADGASVIVEGGYSLPEGSEVEVLK
ncbi:efflux RND transporter periplasmic adaptor subunit [Aggregicoccus sp. 17bor-14]|uniref:efflux RND transporter periplasmic adaptor subunit n=1 Tax=Myxococcaceae TaxID=31 RepID=UPI00129C1EFA|nr:MULTISPECIES: efflux RND transporter periplasmic adaptor subunit [Myxococcaceae]MBF5045940.1 efflux RND transporter periplasmic adaptor subunit [Simulacricoccus sp. 17bor-14]MRI91672.1 efflux RND transporter periplasmic adaptor subunit [Aggregicoccus sp. 17bor-14]